MTHTHTISKVRLMDLDHFNFPETMRHFRRLESRPRKRKLCIPCSSGKQAGRATMTAQRIQSAGLLAAARDSPKKLRGSPNGHPKKPHASESFTPKRCSKRGELRSFSDCVVQERQKTRSPCAKVRYGPVVGIFVQRWPLDAVEAICGFPHGQCLGCWPVRIAR